MKIHSTIVTAFLLSFIAGRAHAQSTQIAGSAVPAAIESVFTSDLDLDTTFGGGDGSMLVDFPFVDNTRHDEGMNTFYHCDNSSSGICTRERYYIVGRHFTGTTNDIVIAKTDSAGTLDTSFGNAGRLLLPTSMSTLRDVAFDPVAGRLYFVGAQAVFLFPDLQFSILCVNVSTEAPCSGFGNPDAGPGYQFVLFNLGSSNTDVASRVLFDPAGFLYVAGYSDAPEGYQVALAKLDATSGALVPGFGNGGRNNYVVGLRNTARDVNVFGMALSDRAEGKQLYLAGDFLSLSTDYDGYVMRVDPSNGATTGTQILYYENDDGGTSLNDAVTAVTVLANGEIAIAGTSDTSTPGRPAIMLARLHPDAGLSYDAGFGDNGLYVQDFTVGLFGWRNTLPSAIGERPDNRDLVVAMQAGTWTFDVVNGNSVLSQKQVVQQYSASGITLHAEQQIGFAGSTGGAAPQFTRGMTVSRYSVDLTGSTVWSPGSDDVDVTLSRMVTNDAIFASQFGASDSD